jgi:hypothetical protein
MVRAGFVAVFAAAVLVAVSSTAGAASKGGPSPGVAVGGSGVVAPGGAVRYVSFTELAGRTLVAAIGTRSGQVMRSRWLDGNYGVPLVTFDGQAEGLTRDGRTLLLAEPNNGSAPSVTHLALLDTRKLKLNRVVSLPGLFAYDALSPDGNTVYLIKYLASQNVPEYEVRAFDLRANRLLRKVIVDPRERGEAMNGTPMTRVTSAGGGWVYTFYVRPEEKPFVHALDAAHRRAVCIDLPWRSQTSSPVRMTLEAGGRQLVLSQRGVGRLAVIDTKTFAVHTVHRP